MVYFYPVLVKGLGYTDPVIAQFITVPILTVGFVFTPVSGIVGNRSPPKRGHLIVSELGSPS
ncbi:hypothetical protein QBC47DRAFT_407885 [Echria macrotheca]|uniref:Uncharacterized protein n=1 Tax=Echria macrotheca TaxID=438768 RepID=A0AAJ0F145_9PEZI|nr:hypothetical protein QBC47DRAFT_407885 [Echria macrotheca]